MSPVLFRRAWPRRRAMAAPARASARTHFQPARAGAPPCIAESLEHRVLLRVTINDVAIVEGDTGSRNLVFTITASQVVVGEPVIVGYFTVDGSARAGSDYQQTQGGTFFNFSGSKTISVPVHGDFDAEGNETFFVDVYGEDDPTFVLDRGTGTIQDDDAPLIASVSDAAALEGTPPGAPGALSFDVSLSRALKVGEPAATVNYATADGTATAADYFGVASTLTFTSGGPISQQVIVQTRPDADIEPHEAFSLNLTAGARTVVGDGQGAGTVQNDDFPPPATVNVGNDWDWESPSFGASYFLDFPVSLSRALADGEVVGVTWDVRPGTATTFDFDGGWGRLTFVAGGPTVQNVSVRLRADDIVERDETVFLDLSEPAGVAIGDGRGVGIIVDQNGGLPTTARVSGPIAPVPEGDSGTTDVVFTLTVDAPNERNQSFRYRTRDGSTTSNLDYEGRDAAVTLPAYESSVTFTIPVRGDVLDEVDEVFYVDLVSLPFRYVAGNSGTAIIRDDDAPPTLHITDVRRDEGNLGVTPFIFDITLSGASGRPVSVTATSAPDSAVSGDFTPGTARLTFNPGETVKSFAVHVNGDTTFEPEERFFVDLSNPDAATITDAQGVGTITDDDGEPGPPLHVTGVFVNSTAWSSAFRSGLAASGLGSSRFGYAVPAADHLNELPWTSLDEVSIRFDGDATVRETDLTLRGVRVPAYAISRFAYDAETDTATWTLGGAIGNDNILIDLRSRSDTGGPGVPRLDGDWFNGLDSFPSGDGFPGGDFRFRASVAPGDATRNGAVTAADEMEVRARQGSARGRRADYGVFHDINGDGAINVRDTVLVRQWMSTRSPAPAAVAAWAGPASPRTRPVTRDLFSSSSLIA